MSGPERIWRYRLEPGKDRVVLTVEGVLEDLQTAERPYRVGIVAPRNVVYGMARMYELLQAEGLEEVRVFPSYEEADDFTAP